MSRWLPTPNRVPCAPHSHLARGPFLFVTKTMFIQTETLSDDNALKFLPGRAVLGDGDELAFADADAAAERAPLAARLFQLDAVSAVTLGSDFISVTKTGDVDWQLIKPAIFGIIMEHFLAGKVMLEDAPSDDGGTVAEILDLIESRIRPGIVEEGGDILFHGFADGVARLELVNKGLAAPAFSLQIRIENTLRHYVTAVTSVVFDSPVAAPTAPAATLDLDDPETAAVYTLLEDTINPQVAAHGGHIALIEVAEHIAYIRLEGGCQGCGMADVTLKQGVEVAILKEVPTIVEVRDATDHEGAENPFYEADKAGVSAFY